MKKIILIAISVMTFFALSLTTFAKEYEYPDLPTPTWSLNDYIIDYSESLDTYTLIYFNDEAWNVVYQGGRYLKFYGQNGDFDKHMQVFKLYSSSNDWEAYTSYEGGTRSFDSGTTFLASTIDIYTDEDQLVFPPPRTLQEVLVEEPQVLMDKVVGVMKTLVVCGVGCLALLIGLNLLRRKSVILLNR